MEYYESVIAIFAYNEENTIIDCLEAIRNSKFSKLNKCFVLANGCTDKTTEIVRAYKKNNEFIELIELNCADKANAWNYFIHEVPIKAAIYFFHDADTQVFPDALEQLYNCLRRNPNVNAVAAKKKKKGSDTPLVINSLWGGLYALAPHFVERIRERKIKLPIGLIGDDGLVGALACWDLNPGQIWDNNKVIICSPAKFWFYPIQINLNGLKKYYFRLLRYSFRYYQNRMITAFFKKYKSEALPNDVKQLYKLFPELLEVKFRGLNTFFDFLVTKKIRKQLTT